MLSSLETEVAIRATLGMGLIVLRFAPFLHAQDYPADITRGKAVYERHCQACHGVGGWGWTGREDSQGGTGQFPPLYVLSEIRRRTVADHRTWGRLQPHAFVARPADGRGNAGCGGLHSSVGPAGALRLSNRREQSNYCGENQNDTTHRPHHNPGITRSPPIGRHLWYASMRPSTTSSWSAPMGGRGSIVSCWAACRMESCIGPAALCSWCADRPMPV